MLFQSPFYIIFLALTLIICHFISGKTTKAFLFAISFFFYASFGTENLPILLFFIIIGAITFYIKSIKKYLFLLIILSLFPLVSFKLKLFISNIYQFDKTNSAVLPLGISFITFTLVSMIVDISKRKNIKYDPLSSSLYISFFPHLLAGPILRSGELIPQLQTISIRWENIKKNLPLFAIGMIKKVLIADQLHTFTQPIFSAPQAYQSIDLVIAAIGFAVQIYCDFSAYSDMAIASAGMFNINFPENFHSPYLSFSLTEIWKRWHMTLGFWLRDYVFIPLVRRCHGSLRYLPIFITMLISGIWHGANWNFLLWGALQGTIMIFENLTGYNRFMANAKVIKGLGILVNITIWTLLLILFNSPNLSSALKYYSSMATMTIHPFTYQNYLVIGLTFLTLFLHKFDNIKNIRNISINLPNLISIPISIVIIVVCCLSSLQRPESFYYFDF